MVRRVPRAQGHLGVREPGRGRGHHRPVGLRQVDVDPLHQPPRGAPTGEDSRRRCRADRRRARHRPDQARDGDGLTASGLSDKSLNYLTDADRTLAIKGLIEKFLEPAGENFIDELVYRYLLTKGDALGGKARNLAGSLGERKFLRSLISVFNISGINYKWKDNDANTWLDKPKDDTGIEKRIKAIYWKKQQDRLMILNTNVPLVNKNVDLLILQGTADELKTGKQSIIYQQGKYIALGELKGGIDPAGADEHWKTANSALNRIRTSFEKKKLKPQTFFVGAAIENAMAVEIFKQLKSGTMSTAANLTNDKQLTAICDWVINL